MNSRSSHRRAFLTKSAATLAVPYFCVAPELGANENSEKIRVATIGVGGRGTAIGMQAARQEHVVACVDVQAQNATRFAIRVNKHQGGECEIFDDYRRVLDRDDIHAITCGTPDHWHTRIAIDAMEAGKDVYCEKPLTLTIGESKTICEVAKATGRIFQVGTQQRSEYGQAFLKAVAIARSGWLGEKLHAISSVGKATAGGPFKTAACPADLDFDFWLGQAPKVDFCKNRIGWNFRWWLEYSGGQVTDWGVHHTDIALWALGGEEEGVIEASGTGKFPGIPAGTDVVAFLNGELRLPHQYNVAQEFECLLKLRNNNSISLTSGKNELLIEGEKGKIRVNRGGLTGRIAEEIAADKEATEKLNRQLAVLYRGMPMNGHMANFFHCIRNNLKPISDVWTHCNSVNACHMANIAMLVGETIKFEPTTYRFDNERANEFIDRKQRGAWKTRNSVVAASNG